MQTVRLFWSLLVVTVATLLAATTANRAAAQEATPDDVLAMLDRVQAQLQQMSSDLDGGASQQTLVQDATGVLALLLSVEDSLRPLYPDWPALRGQAESLYMQASTASPETLRGLISPLQEGLTRAQEAAQRWKASGTWLSLEDVGAYPGEETWVSLFLAKVPSGGVVSYNVTIAFNPDVLRVTKVTFTKGHGAWKVAETGGAVTIQGSGLKLGQSQQPQELAQVWVQVTGKEKDLSVLALEAPSVLDASGAEVPVAVLGGSVRVLAGQAPATGQPAPIPTPAPEGTRVLGLSPVYLAAIVAVLALVLLGAGLGFLLRRR